jgi:hypothetical protein
MAAPSGPRPAADRARVAVRLRPIAAPAAPKASRSVSIATARNACRSCGAKLAIRKRVYCDQCLPDQLAESRRATAANFAAAGPAKIAAMRAAGHDPTQTPEVRRRRAGRAIRDPSSPHSGPDQERGVVPRKQWSWAALASGSTNFDLLVSELGSFARRSGCRCIRRPCRLFHGRTFRCA